jgi:hypothetical protein
VACSEGQANLSYERVRALRQDSQVTELSSFTKRSLTEDRLTALNTSPWRRAIRPHMTAKDRCQKRRVQQSSQSDMILVDAMKKALRAVLDERLGIKIRQSPRLRYRIVSSYSDVSREQDRLRQGQSLCSKTSNFATVRCIA